jgi:hypothetical protein
MEPFPAMAVSRMSPQTLQSLCMIQAPPSAPLAGEFAVQAAAPAIPSAATSSRSRVVAGVMRCLLEASNHRVITVTDFGGF